MMINTPTPQVKTTCPYCGVGCGVIAEIDEQGIVNVKGDPDHPANQGRLCSKGSALGETVNLHDRLLFPEIKGEQIEWEQALSTVAGRFQEIIKEHGPDAVAFYVSGQLLTEDYYVANKLMKGYIGSANIDTNSRLCMSSAVVAHKRAFGEDCVPCSYDDLDHARLIILTGSNTAWCHPILFQRIARAKKANPGLRIVNIDPRETQTSSIADLQLSLAPGSDGFLFNGLLKYLHEQGHTNPIFTQNCTNGINEALEAAENCSVSAVADACNLPESTVETFYQWYAETEQTITVFSQGINQSSSGTDKGNALINCHLLTGRIGRPGMGPFSFTGQPNAMGGREVGGLSNQLAAHLDIANDTHRELVKEYWQSPVIADHEGLKAVDLFDAMDEGKVKAVWIMATNPVVSLPDIDKVKSALQKCELVIVSDCVRNTDTTAYADILLPATTWGERDGTVTNSDRTISRQRPFLSPPGIARHDWQIITEVAQRMGFDDDFPYQTSHEIFIEYAGLTGFRNNEDETPRQLDLSALTELSSSHYDALLPVPWPMDQSLKGTQRLFSDGRFSTPDKKARFIPIQARMPEKSRNENYPFVLNTGRVRDQWHTMTRTGVSPRLSTHTVEPYIEIHPEDALQQQLQDNALASVKSPSGNTMIARVRYSEKQQRGSVFTPMHWNQQYSSNSGIGSLIPAVTDPYSGQPESKHAIVSVELSEFKWYGFVLSANKRKLQLDYADYWVRSKGKGIWRFELAGMDQPTEWSGRAHELLGTQSKEENWIEYFDKAQNQYRAAQFEGERLKQCVFIGQSPLLPERDWLSSLFLKDALTPLERASLLTGQAGSAAEDQGKVICACFSVGEKKIQKAIEEQNLDSVEAIGKCLNAGTNCGSCIPELQNILSDQKTSA